MTKAIGIDIGGTFIDVVVAGDDGARLIKVPSVPTDPVRGVLEALDRLLTEQEIAPEDVRRVVHGSTVATNALLEGTWARTALITTRGFRDVLEIGRQNRPSLYDLFVTRPPLLVPRDLRFEVTERIDASGNVLVPLATDEVESLVSTLCDAEVEAIAIVLLFSYVDPTHERAIRRILSSQIDAPILISSDVLPEFREYERTSTTAASAALRPVVGDYLTELERRAGDLGLPQQWQIMQSSGSVTNAETAQQEPARVVLSGPAGGVKGAAVIGRIVGERNLVTMDMGGTSCDVSLIRDGQIEWTTSGVIGGYPVALPMVEIHTIGAGGGSIAWVDPGGALRVGPQSAGADPGPACYGRGGNLPTVTDAHLVLGHLVPDRALGGLGALNLEKARRAVGAVADPLGLTIERTALGMLEVADAAMERAIRVISVERGHDPRDFALLAFGGAGPLHAISIARRLSVPRAIVPATAGVLSAFGLLAAETGHDAGLSVVRPLGNISPAWLGAVLADLRQHVESVLRSEGVHPNEIRFNASVDLRYVGQSHEVNLDFPDGTGERIEQGTGPALAAAFHAAHEARFGHSASQEEVELVTLRVRATGPPTPVELKRRGRSESTLRQHVMTWFDADGPTKAGVKDRGQLAPRTPITGPLLVVGEDATLLVPPGVTGRCDEHGNVTLEVR